MTTKTTTTIAQRVRDLERHAPKIRRLRAEAQELEGGAQAALERQDYLAYVQLLIAANGSRDGALALMGRRRRKPSEQEARATLKRLLDVTDEEIDLVAGALAGTV